MRTLKVGGLRTRLWIAVVLAVTVALAAIAVIFNLVLADRLSADAQNVLRSRAFAELSSLRQIDGRLTVVEAPDDAATDTQVWVFTGTRELEHPRASPAVSHAARLLAGGPRRTAEVHSFDTRLLAVPIVRKGIRLGTVVAGISLKPYERTRPI